MWRVLKSRKGFSDVIILPIALGVILTFIVGGMVMFGELAKVGKLKQIAQQVAREISLTGKVDSTVENKLNRMADSLNLSGATMRVEGQYLGGSSTKLVVETDFTVTITYRSNYRIGGLVGITNEKEYMASADGTVEEYHKE